jgi:hypothetical protein
MDAVLHTEVLNALAYQQVIIVFHFLLGGEPLDNAKGIYGFAGSAGFFLIIQRMGGIQHFLPCLGRDV